MFGLLTTTFRLRCIKALGNVTRATEFGQAADKHAAAIHKRFFNATINGYVDTRQGHLVLALFSGSVPPILRDSVLGTLRDEIYVRQGGHIDTGRSLAVILSRAPTFMLTRAVDVGLTTTYLMYKFLSDSAAGFGGYEDVAYTLTVAQGHPGYLAILDNGATTFPEHWGYCHDAGSCCMEADWKKSCCDRVYQCTNYSGCTTSQCTTSAGSSSKIHGTLNGVGQLFVAGIGGIRRPVGGVGYQIIEFRAPFGRLPGVSHVQASYRSLYGLIESSWASPENGSTYSHNVTVPPNCVATLRIQGARVWESGSIIQTTRDDEGLHVVAFGSGEYFFVADNK